MPIYMNVDKIKGDVSEAAHEKWIELQSCQFGVHRSVTNAVGRGTNREAAAPSISEIVVTKEYDDASTDLFKWSLGGDGKKVKIDFTRADKEKIVVFLTIELENTLISSYSASGHGGVGGGNKPMESLSLNFTKILWTAQPSDIKGSTSGQKPMAQYDLATGKAS